MNQIKNESVSRKEESLSSKQDTQYWLELVKLGIQDIKVMFGVEINLIPLGDGKERYFLESEWAKQKGRHDSNMTRQVTLEEMHNILVGMYSALYVKGMSERGYIQ